ncbi:MAG: hypothetical protein WDO70_03635 [Alphaproteobacteria bacterium]
MQNWIAVEFEPGVTILDSRRAMEKALEPLRGKLAGLSIETITDGGDIEPSFFIVGFDADADAARTVKARLNALPSAPDVSETSGPASGADAAASKAGRAIEAEMRRAAGLDVARAEKAGIPVATQHAVRLAAALRRSDKRTDLKNEP